MTLKFIDSFIFCIYDGIVCWSFGAIWSISLLAMNRKLYPIVRSFHIFQSHSYIAGCSVHCDAIEFRVLCSGIWKFSFVIPYVITSLSLNTSTIKTFTQRVLQRVWISAEILFLFMIVTKWSWNGFTCNLAIFCIATHSLTSTRRNKERTWILPHADESRPIVSDVGVHACGLYVYVLKERLSY